VTKIIKKMTIILNICSKIFYFCTVMARPKHKRFIESPPAMEGFRPFGIPLTDLEPVILLFEEFESIRLLDFSGMKQEEAAAVMGISRPTLTRIYEKARRTIAEAFVLGKAIFIEGGDFHSSDFWYRCKRCYKLVISEKSVSNCPYCQSATLLFLSNKEQTMNQEKEKGNCICPHCNHLVEHQRGIPCRETECPVCGKKMVREGSYHHQLIIQKKAGKANENSSSK
jgi:predicted DNA-binding protein (UPF0251 family)